MLLSLIGYRGTGKSSIAPLIATRLGWASIDSDVEIEHRTQNSIREIFGRGGETEFRRIERDVMSELLSREALVIACGGGAVLNEQTRAEMKSAGPVIWLQASVETISKRLLADPSTQLRRPRLTGQSQEQEIRSLVSLREPVYRSTASITIRTDGKSPEQITDEILEAVRPQVKESQDDSF